MRVGGCAGSVAPGLWPGPSKLGDRAAVRPDYKHDALGLIILKLIPHTFEAKHAVHPADYPEGMEDPNVYAAEKMFRAPKEAHWLPCSTS
jgi:hypothetical protein